MSKRNLLIIGLIVLAILSRIIPHPANFTPLIAVAMFGAAYLGKKLWMFLIPIAAFWLSDIALNNTIYAQYYEGFTLFHSGLLSTFIALGIIVAIAIPLLKKVNIKTFLGTGLLGSICFFLVSNLAVWMTTGLYPMNFGGLIACYVAAIPFFINTLFGTIIYGSALFGLYNLAVQKRLIPSVARS